MRLTPRTLHASSTTDISRLVALDQRSATNPWTMASFARCLGKPKNHGIGVYDSKDALRGYVIYDSSLPGELSIVSLLVDSGFRRIGIGSGLLDCVRAGMNSIGLEARFSVYFPEDDDVLVKFFTSYKTSRRLYLQTSLVRGGPKEPRDWYCFSFQEALSGVCA